ncbi:MAG: ferrous iron transport protein A [Coriobacteriia bacterium]|nr:ferrous iron transport protein A [Coriobacteriia bacterium]
MIESVLGGPQMQTRLENMGLRPGKTVTKLSAMPSGGPVMVECGGSRIALGRQIAHHVRVRRAGQATGPGTDRDV